MKRAALAMICCAALLASPAGMAAADPASDRDMALRYQQAAQSDDDDAQFYLGALYSAGVGVQRSDEEAFRWLSRAADHGHIHAMLILAGLCAIGRGAPQDNVSAYKWAYIVAYASKVDEFKNGARQLMGVLETRLTADQVYAAKTNASRWHAVPTAKPAISAQPAPALASTVANALPQPAAPSLQPQSPAKVTVYPSPQPASPQPASPQPAKKSDADNLLDQVPQGLRKKFGF
jgi:Sel1 repeat-containing protein